MHRFNFFLLYFIPGLAQAKAILSGMQVGLVQAKSKVHRASFDDVVSRMGFMQRK